MEGRQNVEGAGYQIEIDASLCTGCGACMEVCPMGALYLVEGKAMVDESLCRGCEACIAACRVGAITLMTRKERVGEATRLPAIQPKPEVVRVDTDQARAPTRSQVMPVVGAALSWAGREIVPRLADIFLDKLDRRAADRRMTKTAQQRDIRERGGQGGRHRRRHRGGRG